MAEVEARQIAILETVEDIQNRREQVLRRYAEFKEATRLRRQRLEDAKRYHQFKRDADEVEAWINEKLQIACDENYKDPTNLQVRFWEVKRDLLLKNRAKFVSRSLFLLRQRPGANPISEVVLRGILIEAMVTVNFLVFD